MARRPKQPWYWRDGYYVVIRGKRHLLARGPKGDEVLAQAVEKLLTLIELPKSLTFLREASVSRILDAAPPHLYRPLALIDAAGCRPGEVVSVTAADLDGEAQAIRLANGTPHERRVQIPELWPSVWEWGRQALSGPVCRNSDGGPWTVDALHGAFGRLRDRLGIDRRATLRHLRHSHAIRLLGSGGAVAEVALRLGVTEKHVRSAYWEFLPLDEGC